MRRSSKLASAPHRRHPCPRDRRVRRRRRPQRRASAGSNDERRRAPASDIKVGMAYDVGGRGDQSFNDSAATGLDQANEELGVEAEESEAAGRRGGVGARGAPRTFAEAGYDPIIAVGFAYAESVGKVAARVPRRPLRDHRRLQPRRRPERRQPGLRRGAGLVPGRRGRGAEVRGRPHRLRRRRPGATDREVPGRLRGGRQGGQPGHQDRRHLPDPAAGLLRIQ